jgi:cbb3-type cytochrome oxidase subunit 3
MSVFLNLALFVGVFYLIILYAGRPDRRKTRAGGDVAERVPEKRIA